MLSRPSRIATLVAFFALLVASPALMAQEDDPQTDQEVQEETEPDDPQQDVEPEEPAPDETEPAPDETEPPAEQQDPDPVTEPDPDAPDPPGIDGPFSPGNFDILMHGGVTRWGTWLWVEPGAELGIMELSDGIVLGGGANLNVGWCGLCTLFQGLTRIERLRGWYVSPTVRPTIHFNVLADALNVPQLDVYAGFVAGASWYQLSMEIASGTGAGTEAESNVFSLLGGPLLGGRYTLTGDAGFFVAAEVRMLFEAGISTTTVQVETEENEQLVSDQARNVRRGASLTDWNLAIGFRF